MEDIAGLKILLILLIWLVLKVFKDIKDIKDIATDENLSIPHLFAHISHILLHSPLHLFLSNYLNCCRRSLLWLRSSLASPRSMYSGKVRSSIFNRCMFFAKTFFGLKFTKQHQIILILFPIFFCNMR